MKESENILRILEETINAINKNNPIKLKELSDQTIHSASTGDEENILVAIIVYSLGKIISRQDYRKLKGWSSFKRLTNSSLKQAIKDLKKEKEDKFKKDLKLTRKAINKISGKLKKYIEEVFQKAEINKASRIHEHGISLEKTAKMLGITMFELQNYTGKTGISEVSLNQTIDVKTRINVLEDIFNI